MLFALTRLPYAQATQPVKAALNKAGIFYPLLVLLTAFIAWLDFVTGYELRFGVFYFIPIALAAWHKGHAGALFAVIASFIGWGFSNLTAPVASDFVRYWNATSVLIGFLVIGWTMTRVGQEVKRLRRLLPICSCCKKVRNDKGYWEQVEYYFRDHDKTKFEHSMCPECGDRLHKPVVLHAEDDPDEIFLFKNAVTKADLPHQLFSIDDCQKVIDWLSGKNEFADRAKFPLPDVLLVDLRMPGLNGFELLTWIRAQREFKNLPVLVVSSSDEPDYIKRAYDLGATSYFVKSARYAEVTDFLRTSRL